MDERTILDDRISVGIVQDDEQYITLEFDGQTYLLTESTARVLKSHLTKKLMLLD